MTNTTNYNFLLAEGTDLVNYLTQTNPNFTSLDTIIKNVSNATITTATEVTSGTAHAITRTDTDVNVFRFVASSNWTTGDTITVEGVTVTPLKTDGTSLKTGDYVIGSSILCILDGSRLTVIVSSSPAAADVRYDNSGSGMTATTVQGAIDEQSTAINQLGTDLSFLRMKSAYQSMANNASANISTEAGIVFLVRNSTVQLTDVYSFAVMGTELRVQSLSNAGLIDITYSSGVTTITNRAGAYIMMMCLYI